MKEIPPDKSCLQREIPLDYSENPPHQPMKKVSYSKKISRTTARIPPPAYEKSFLHPNFYLQKSPKGNLIKVAKILNFVYPWESLPIQKSEEVKPSTKDK